MSYFKENDLITFINTDSKMLMCYKAWQEKTSSVLCSKIIHTDMFYHNLTKALEGNPICENGFKFCLTYNLPLINPMFPLTQQLWDCTEDLQILKTMLCKPEYDFDISSLRFTTMLEIYGRKSYTITQAYKLFKITKSKELISNLQTQKLITLNSLKDLSELAHIILLANVENENFVMKTLILPYL